MSGSGGGFSITFKAVDQATKTFAEINKSLDNLTKPAQRFTAQISKMGDVTGINKIAQGMGSVASSTLDVFRSMSRVIPALGLITSAGSLAGMAAFAKSWADSGREVGEASKRIGIGVAALTQLQGASRLAGLSTEAMTTSLAALGTTMRDALGGRNQDALRMFGVLGFNQNDLSQGVDKMLPRIADRIQKLSNPQDQERAANALGLGGILPLLRQGAAGIEKYRQEADKYNPVSPHMIEDAEKLAHSFKQVEESVSGFFNTLSSKTTPSMAPFLTSMADWVAQNRDVVATDLAGWLEGWVKVIRPVPGLIKDINDGFKALTGFNLGPAGNGLMRALPFGLDPRGIFGLQPWNMFSAPSGGAGGSLAGPRADGRGLRSSGGGGSAEQESYQFWLGKGLSPAQAAGMAAQEMAESKGDPNARGDYDRHGRATAHGAYQWHADRRRRILANTGIDVSNSNIQQQREAAYWEFMNVEHEARRRVLGSTTAQEAGAGATEFERPDPNRRSIIDLERGRDAAGILGRASRPGMIGRNMGERIDDARMPPGVDGDISGQNGHVKVEVTIKGATPGTSASVSQGGAVRAGAPKIETPMEGYGALP